jgi:hypothetical protein
MSDKLKFKKADENKDLWWKSEGDKGCYVFEPSGTDCDRIGRIKTVDEDAGVVILYDENGIKTTLTLDGKVCKIGTTKQKIAEPNFGAGSGFERGK